MKDEEFIVPVKFRDDRLLILDQTLLPGEEKYIELETKESVWDAILKLKVRGAPAIGVAAAYGLYISVRNSKAETLDEFGSEIEAAADYLVTARPTAVNLAWALQRMKQRFAIFCMDAAGDQRMANDSRMASDSKMAGDQRMANDSKMAGDQRTAGGHDGKSGTDFRHSDVDAAKAALLDEAEKIRIEDEESCRAMGEYGLTLLKSGMGILTHCNAGTLATAKYGTCLAPIYLGSEQGYDFRVFADETRPLLQGARLTSWELSKAGIDVTLICDNMASIVMKNGWIDAIVVGCDRMAANGDGANKIGTSGVAILAKEYGIPFYMFVPTSTIDLNTPTGDDIKIELREGSEIYEMWYEKPMAPEGIKTYNPSFDVTAAKYITAVVTEKGIVRPPYKENLAKLFEK